MSDVAEQQETSLETMQSVLERQSAHTLLVEVGFANGFDGWPRNPSGARQRAAFY